MIQNSCLMNVFKDEEYCLNGPLIEVIEFPLKTLKKAHFLKEFVKNSARGLLRDHCEVSLFLLFLSLEDAEV